MFEPKPGEVLVIRGASYVVSPHPRVPRIPYVIEGGAGYVMRLESDRGVFALKWFKDQLRRPEGVRVAERIREYAQNRGLTVCDRVVLEPGRDRELLVVNQELLYSVLMPWIEGPTWMLLWSERRAAGATPVTPEASLNWAQGLAAVFRSLETDGLAHCDISGGNVILTHHDSSSVGLELVDVESLFSPVLGKPLIDPLGTPGYRRNQEPFIAWTPLSDRFAGAVMLAEMLGLCDERVRAAGKEECYFGRTAELAASDAAEFRLLSAVLAERWGDRVQSLFERAWQARGLSECPPFGEWELCLPQEPLPARPQSREAEDALRELLAPRKEECEAAKASGSRPRLEAVTAAAERLARSGGPPFADDVRWLQSLRVEEKREEPRVPAKPEDLRLLVAVAAAVRASNVAEAEALLPRLLELSKRKPDATHAGRRIIEWVNMVQSLVSAERDRVSDQSEVPLPNGDAMIFDRAEAAVRQKDRAACVAARPALLALVRRNRGFVRNGTTAGALLVRLDGVIGGRDAPPWKLLAAIATVMTLACAFVVLLMGSGRGPIVPDQPTEQGPGTMPSDTLVVGPPPTSARCVAEQERDDEITGKQAGAQRVWKVVFEPECDVVVTLAQDPDRCDPSLDLVVDYGGREDHEVEGSCVKTVHLRTGDRQAATVKVRLRGTTATAEYQLTVQGAKALTLLGPER